MAAGSASSVVISMPLVIATAAYLCTKYADEPIGFASNPVIFKKFNVSSDEMHNSAVRKLERVNYFLCKVGFCPSKLPQVCKAEPIYQPLSDARLTFNFYDVYLPRIG
jgi:hypothetical protein